MGAVPHTAIWQNVTLIWFGFIHKGQCNILVHLGVNTTTEIKPGSLWRHLLQDFCRDLLVTT